eukprot:tig00000257_g22832.t1
MQRSNSGGIGGLGSLGLSEEISKSGGGPSRRLSDQEQLEGLRGAMEATSSELAEVSSERDRLLDECERLADKVQDLERAVSEKDRALAVAQASAGPAAMEEAAAGVEELREALEALARDAAGELDAFKLDMNRLETAVQRVDKAKAGAGATLAAPKMLVQPPTPTGDRFDDFGEAADAINEMREELRQLRGQVKKQEAEMEEALGEFAATANQAIAEAKRTKSPASLAGRGGAEVTIGTEELEMEMFQPNS